MRLSPQQHCVISPNKRYVFIFNEDRAPEVIERIMLMADDPRYEGFDLTEAYRTMRVVCQIQFNGVLS